MVVWSNYNPYRTTHIWLDGLKGCKASQLTKWTQILCTYLASLSQSQVLITKILLDRQRIWAVIHQYLINFTVMLHWTCLVNLTTLYVIPDSIVSCVKVDRNSDSPFTAQRWRNLFFILSKMLEYKTFPSHPVIVKENVDLIHKVTSAFLF